MFFKRPPEIHLTINNVVQNNVKSEQTVADKEEIIRLQSEVAELSRRNHNQAQSIARQQDEIKEARTVLRELVRVADEQETILVEAAEHTGYCGCDLEKRHSVVAEKARVVMGRF